MTDTIVHQNGNAKQAEREAVAQAVAEAIRAGGVEKGREVLTVLARADGTLPPAAIDIHKRLYTESELSSITSPRLLYNAGGIQIPANALALLNGPSGKGKSFVTTHWALSLAQEGKSVVYIAAEKFALYRDRQRAWYLHHKAASKNNVHWYDGTPNLMNADEVEELISLIEPLSPSLVIIDTLARCMVGGDENSARDMGLAVRGCGRIMQATGATVLLVHHTTKDGRTERGSGALRGACDTVIDLANDDEVITLSCSKQSGAAEFEPVYLRLLPVTVGTNAETGESVTNCVLVPAEKIVTMPGQKLTKSQRAVLEVLALDVFTDTGAKSAQLRESLPGMSPNTLYKTLSALKKLQYVSQGTKGDPFTITTLGIGAIS